MSQRSPIWLAAAVIGLSGGAPAPAQSSPVVDYASAGHTKRQAEANVLKIIPRAWKHSRILGLIDSRTGLLCNNVRPVCNGRGPRSHGRFPILSLCRATVAIAERQTRTLCHVSPSGARPLSRVLDGISAPLAGIPPERAFPHIPILKETSQKRSEIGSLQLKVSVRPSIAGVCAAATVEYSSSCCSYSHRVQPPRASSRRRRRVRAHRQAGVFRPSAVKRSSAIPSPPARVTGTALRRRTDSSGPGARGLVTPALP